MPCPRAKLAPAVFTALLVMTASGVWADPFAHSAAVSNQTLGRIAGGNDIAQAIFADNTSNVSNNSVNGTSVTGIITIDGQAFQNFNGLALLNANTGNNVSINSSMNVNITTSP